MPRVITDAELATCKAEVDKRMGMIIKIMRSSGADELQVYYVDYILRPMLYALRQALVASRPPNAETGDAIDDASQREIDDTLHITVSFIAFMVIEVNSSICDPIKHPNDFVSNISNMLERINASVFEALRAGPVDGTSLPGAH